MNITLTQVRFFERAMKMFRSKTAVVCQGHRWTYAEYGDRVERLSNALEDLGVGPQDRVAYLGYNCHRLLECYYGVVKTGAVLMPLNIRLSSGDLEYIIQDAEPKVIFVDADFLDKLKPIVSKAPFLKNYILLNNVASPEKWVSKTTYDSLLEKTDPSPRRLPGEYPFSEDDVAELFYTSGTTGPPKGVMLTHRNLYLHALESMTVYPITETDVMIHIIPLFHVNGWGIPHYLTSKGGTHVMMQKFNAETVLELMQSERVSRLFAIPTMIQEIMDRSKLKTYDMSSLKDVLIGGAPPPSGMSERAENTFRCTVHTGFGMTETCPMLAAPELPPGLDRETLRHRARGTWGFPLIGVEFKIVDESGQELPWDGQSVGELVVRGDMVMKGYWKKEEETATALAGGWFHTGDLVSIDQEGSLYIRDRKKDIIISGGENISSLEIEQVLYSHPDILECAVIGKLDPKWGEIPKAIVVLKPGATLKPEEIISYTRSRMTHFKAVREAVIIDAMPRGGTGKIMKSALRSKYGQLEK
jgi:fatty-acyl-CoA synthase